MTLYNDDCLKILRTMPDKSVDLVITDPPYEVSATNGGGSINKIKKLNQSLKDLTDLDITEGYDFENVNNELVRVMKKISIYQMQSIVYISEKVDFVSLKITRTHRHFLLHLLTKKIKNYINTQPLNHWSLWSVL